MTNLPKDTIDQLEAAWYDYNETITNILQPLDEMTLSEFAGSMTETEELMMKHFGATIEPYWKHRSRMELLCRQVVARAEAVDAAVFCILHGMDAEKCSELHDPCECEEHQ